MLGSLVLLILTTDVLWHACNYRPESVVAAQTFFSMLNRAIEIARRQFSFCKQSTH